MRCIAGCNLGWHVNAIQRTVRGEAAEYFDALHRVAERGKPNANHSRKIGLRVEVPINDSWNVRAFVTRQLHLKMNVFAKARGIRGSPRNLLKK
jgi:hypothetical protein